MVTFDRIIEAITATGAEARKSVISAGLYFDGVQHGELIDCVFVSISKYNTGGHYNGSAANVAAAAETEPGELDQWTWKEHARIQEAIRAALIREYRNPWKTTHTPKFIYSPKEYAATAQDTKIFICDAFYSKLDTLQNE